MSDVLEDFDGRPSAMAATGEEGEVLWVGMAGTGQVRQTMYGTVCTSTLQY